MVKYFSPFLVTEYNFGEFLNLKQNYKTYELLNVKSTKNS